MASEKLYKKSKLLIIFGIVLAPSMPLFVWMIYIVNSTPSDNLGRFYIAIAFGIPIIILGIISLISLFCLAFGLATRIDAKKTESLNKLINTAGSTSPEVTMLINKKLHNKLLSEYIATIAGTVILIFSTIILAYYIVYLPIAQGNNYMLILATSLIVLCLILMIGFAIKKIAKIKTELNNPNFNKQS